MGGGDIRPQLHWSLRQVSLAGGLLVLLGSAFEYLLSLEEL